MKTFRFLLVLLSVFLVLPSLAYSQNEVNPGCKIAWEAPLIEDLPDNPGTQISQWVHAGDHKGFVFVTRKDALHDWDKLLEQPIADPSLLEIDCPTIGVEDLGEYSVGITSQDFALNQSKVAWITFRLIEQDNTALSGIAELCMNGTHLGQPIQTCQKSIVVP